MWSVNLLSVSLFIMQVRCSIPIGVTLSRKGRRPRPASFNGLCTLSSGKLGRRRSMACLIAVLLSMPTIVLSCHSSNTPRFERGIWVSIVVLPLVFNGVDLVCVWRGPYLIVF